MAVLVIETTFLIPLQEQYQYDSERDCYIGVFELSKAFRMSNFFFKCSFGRPAPLQKLRKQIPSSSHGHVDDRRFPSAAHLHKAVCFLKCVRTYNLIRIQQT